MIVEVGEDCGDNERNTFAVGAGASFEVNTKGLVWVESVTSFIGRQALRTVN